MFVPLLHAAVGRLHPDARTPTTPQYGSVPSTPWPAAPVHALHTLQQLATEEGPALPVVEARMLLALAAKSNARPHNALPDGYIPATVQEALLHVFMGEREASSLLRVVVALTQPGPPAPRPPTSPHAENRMANASSSSSSLSASGKGPAARQVHGEFDTLQGQQLQAALASLDPFSLEIVFLQPCHVFRTPPACCKPQLRRALRWVLRLIRRMRVSCPLPVRPSLARTKVWNCAGLLPHGVPALAPDSPIWVGDNA